MTFTLIVLLVILGAGLWLAVDLLRPSVEPRLRTATLSQEAGRGIGFEPMARLLREDDIEYLTADSDLRDLLRSRRRVVLRLYLQRLKLEFSEAWQVCRLLAPISADPRVASRLSHAYWSFHWTYACATVLCAAPSWALQGSASAELLLKSLEQIRKQAQELLAASDLELSAPAAA